MEGEEKEVRKKRLTPESTILLTLGTGALIVIVYGILHFIITSI